MGAYMRSFNKGASLPTARRVRHLSTTILALDAPLHRSRKVYRIITDVVLAAGAIVYALFSTHAHAHSIVGQRLG